jgi:hypothetical protein
MESESGVAPPKRVSRTRWITFLLAGLLLIWLIAAYVIIPFVWNQYAGRHPAFDDHPRVTQTGDHHPGDPLNVALYGEQAQLEAIMKTAKWYQSTALGIRSDLQIAADTILSRPDDDAPVSSLYLLGRKEDLAFEQPVGDNPRHRHHVRFWKTRTIGEDGRPQWIGSAVYDQRVGLSHTTGQITHVTAPAIDVERDYLFECLQKTGELVERYVVDGFHQQREGRNGGGDPWHTDGDLYVGVVAERTP